MSPGAAAPPAPPTLAAVCGALGNPDPARVEAIARALPRRPAEAHREPGALLLLDREPLRWEWDGERGIAWPEQAVAMRAAADRDDALANGPALISAGAGARLHASVSGLSPLYFHAQPEAVYFASTIDALARAVPARLGADWEAWAAILTLGYPVGDRTPFAEIRRLGPACCLRWGPRGVAIERPPWPWERVEPLLDVAEGADEVLSAMREAVAAIPAGPLVCQLSGGLDSRLCLALLADAGRSDVLALTADQDQGDDAEWRVAAAVAAELGFAHEAAPNEPAAFWGHFAEQARRVEYQLVRQPWRMTLLEAMRARPGAVVDGFGFDTFAAPGDRFFTPATADPAGGDDVVQALWATVARRRARPGATGLRPELAEALWDSAERQLFASSERFRGHPARALLTFYCSRQVRGIASEWQCTLGSEVPVAAPLAGDRVARAALAIELGSKRGGALYDALFRALAPGLAELPTTRRAVPGARPVPRRSQTSAAASAMLACLRAGPLAEQLLPSKLRPMARRGEPRVPMGLQGAAVMHLWHERYRDRLREVDVGEALGS